MTEPYEVDLTKPARRALAEQLPVEVAMAASEFILGPLADNPHRVGKPLDEPLDGFYSARVMREWRILYKIDDSQRRIKVQSIRHRRDAYRSH
ncbi:type II toxin-antitoxin system RelE/ParE family toxin [Saccharopolyspora sp. ASAGF58]|uniref:type II toxin-antitoxin system RelE family toxin n=1 Tax=Saccharopolyspora sp. ASAGF58 TaxID=2719023 RepID=UPI001FF0DE0A|nr:type II toxin-antitoxin system RelE/ParE family toxin [Saccharopolyspora sp. ASAGF58]